MRIWIDLANAPHVAFFTPIVHELEGQGHSVIISMRDFNQTVQLAEKSGLNGTVIGEHGGKNPLGKVANLVGRSIHLAAFGRRERADIAVSHNSYPQTIAGRMIGARVVTIMDYEGQPANHIAFRLAHKVIVPAVFPEEDLRRFGCSESRTIRYDGFKEQVYLSDFSPDPAFFRELSESCRFPDDWSPEEKVLVTVRTPADMAAYHPFENQLFEKLLHKLEASPGVTTILLPRTPEQRKYYQESFPKVRVPAKPLPGRDLMYYSDLVVSAGGTMNREAAVLGTPACTIFAGRLPAVDRSLIEMGRLVAIESEEDLERLQPVKKQKGQVLANPGLCTQVAAWIVSS